MLLYFISRIISSTGAFLYPMYASYKTLSRRPASEAELERWLMYWSVLGAIVGVEYIAEWAVSWIPFYHPLKTLFLLYLALPQTRGGSYLYMTHLRPLLASYEAEIDATMKRVKQETYRWAQNRARGLWDHFVTNATPDAHPAAPGSAASPPPSQSDPVSGPTQLAYGWWQTYSPIILAMGAAFMQPRPDSQPQTSSPSAPPETPPGSRLTEPPARRGEVEPRGATSAVDVHGQEAGSLLLARRRALEAELAALPLPNPHDGPAFPIPQWGSSTYLPAPGDDRGRYEEIGKDEAEDEEGYDETDSPRRTSWWWGRSEGYERVKTD